MKASPSDLVAAGFSYSMFSQEANWDAADGYLEKLLTDVATDVEHRVGSALYGEAAGVDALRLKRAEVELAKAELWRRRVAAMSAQLVEAREDQSIASQMREFKRSAAEAEERGWELLALVNPSAAAPGAGLSSGYVETGAFET